MCTCLLRSMHCLNNIDIYLKWRQTTDRYWKLTFSPLSSLITAPTPDKRVTPRSIPYIDSKTSHSHEAVHMIVKPKTTMTTKGCADNAGFVSFFARNRWFDKQVISLKRKNNNNTRSFWILDMCCWYQLFACYFFTCKYCS